MDLLGVSSILEVGSKILDRVIPDPEKRIAAELELHKLNQAGEFKEIDVQLAQMTAQTDINKVQAASSSLFISGPRPALMWVGVFGVGCLWILFPIVSFFVALYASLAGKVIALALPVIDPNLMLMLFSLMGIHQVTRTYEKTKDVASR